jgi:hypothetical protein
MPTYRPSGSFLPSFSADDNTKLVGGTLSAFTAGTTNPVTMHTDIDGTQAGAIVTLNARGEPEVSGNTVQIWLDATLSYKFVLKDADGVAIWTIDNITA